MEFSEYNRPEMLIFGKYASWTLFFQSILTNPIISEISLLWRHHFSTVVFDFNIGIYITVGVIRQICLQRGS